MGGASSPFLSDVCQWEIWQVYWVHEDGTGKERPALAFSTSAQNQASGYVRFLKITSEDHPDVPCRLQISASDSQFPHTGLDKTSWIHFLDEQKVPAANLRFRRGHINALTAAYLTRRLQKLIGM
ncbi:MAG TPA: type II toxin-antitoxin system PemK/MazF family toxin [Tepidisphaeraceae bacterium]|nr:type II toxin-antitoxin system PemK/MazF family toxin [Tepidisphaeraceae bacterium]